MEEAIARGLLPRYDPDAPLVMDMRRMPPVVAEVGAAGGVGGRGVWGTAPRSACVTAWISCMLGCSQIGKAV